MRRFLYIADRGGFVLDTHGFYCIFRHKVAGLVMIIGTTLISCVVATAISVHYKFGMGFGTTTNAGAQSQGTK